MMVTVLKIKSQRVSRIDEESSFFRMQTFTNYLKQYNSWDKFTNLRFLQIPLQWRQVFFPNTSPMATEVFDLTFMTSRNMNQIIVLASLSQALVFVKRNFYLHI